MLKRDKQQAIFTRAQKALPRGVTSNFRYWGDDKTLVASRAKGAYVWDADDNRYIDYRLGFGPIILGHSYDALDDYVAEASHGGHIYALVTEREVRVAEKMAELCPCVDMVRFASSGTEATMHAVRVARAYTGKDKIIKFEGSYHGMYDYLLWSTYQPVETMGNRRSPIPVQASSGIPGILRDLIITLPYNDFELLERTFKRSAHDVAAIIVEPIQGNSASIEPVPGFLQHIRKLCDQYGVLFIMDEVKTGFRLAPGGAQEFFGVTPDLASYAKALGNGYPIAAFGGKRDIMDIIGRGVAHAGTYSGNTVGVAAAEKVLEILADGRVLAEVAERGKQLQKGIGDVLEQHGLPYVVTGHPAMFTFLIADHMPRDYRDWASTDHGLYDRIAWELVQRGVMPDPDSREPWFMSHAHSEQDIAETLTALDDAVGAALRDGHHA